MSDAIALGGLPAGLDNDALHEVLPSGKVVLAGTPYLAGAGHLLDTCVANALRFTNAPLADVVRAATVTPARLLGFEDRLARPEMGAPATFVRFRLPEGEGPLVFTKVDDDQAVIVNLQSPLLSVPPGRLTVTPTAPAASYL